jgi:uncharacterized protein YndB with AHSA1/START domain
MAPRGAKAARAALDDDDVNRTEAVLVSEVIPATRERIYTAWLNSDQHSAFTGEEAVIEPVVGGAHSSLTGYARGTTLALEPFRRIVQSWRAREFPADCADSTVEITLEETVGGTLVTLLHTEIPNGQSDRYREGWLRSYLEPLKRYFTGRVTNGVHKADTQALRGKRAKRPERAAAPARKAGKAKGRARTKVAAKAPGKVKARATGKGGKRAAPARGGARPAKAPARTGQKRTQKTGRSSKASGRKRATGKSRPRKRP